jgi:predicted nucleic acid-binding protein
MEPNLYIETSIISYLTARRSRDIITAARQEITRRWWSRRRGDFTLYTSDIVIEEAIAGDVRAARRRLAALEGIEELKVDDDAQVLAGQLLRQGPLPEKAAVDALHIAVASTCKMAYLLTWNCKHLANAAMRNKIEEICRTNGHMAPIICTPEELMEA